MTVVGSATLELRGDASQLQSELQRASDRFQAIGQSMITVGTRLTGLVTLPLVGLGAAAVSAATDLDSLMRGLTAVTGSAAMAEAQFERLREIAKLPGLNLEQAIQGATNLQAAGLSAETSERALRAFGNALATVGRGSAELDGVVRALTQIQAKGVVSAEEINQLAERLPQIREAMRAAFGTASTEEIQKMGLTVDQFIEGIIGEFEKLPPVSEGARVSFENLADSLTIMAAAFGDVLLPVIIPVVDAIAGAAEWVGNLDPVVQTLIVTVGGLAAALGPVVVALGLILTNLPLLAAGWAALTGPIGLAVTAIVGLGVVWAKWGDDITRIARETFEAVRHWFEDVFGGIVRTIRGHIESVSNAFRWLKDQVVGNSHVPDLIEGIRDEFAKLDEVMVAPVLAAVAKVDAAFAGIRPPNLTPITAAGNANPMAFPSAFPGIGQIFGKVTGALNALIPTITAASGALALFAPIVKGVGEVLGPAFDALMEPLVEVGRVLGNIIKPILDALKRPLELLAQLLILLLEPLRVFVDLLVAFDLPLRILAAVLRVVAVAFSYLYQAMGLFVEALGKLVDKLIPDFISKAGKGLAETGREMQENARAIREGTKEVEDAKEDEKDAIDDATQAARGFTDAMGAATGALLNVPQGFRINNLELARFNASRSLTAADLSGGLATPPLGAAEPGPLSGGGGRQQLFFNITQQAGENGLEFAKRVADIVVRAAVQKNLTDGKRPSDAWSPA